MYLRRSTLLFVAVALAGSTHLLVAQGDQSRTPEQRRDIETLVQLVDSTLMGDVGITVPDPAAPPPTEAPTPTPLAFGGADRTEGVVPVTWLANHFVMGQGGDTYIPFTLQVDRSQLADGASLYIRIVTAEQATAFGAAMAALAVAPPSGEMPDRPDFAWDSIHFVDVPSEGTLERAVQLPPGQYVAYFAIKPQAAADADAAAEPPAGLLRHELDVPDFDTDGLDASSVILARSIEPLAAPLPPEQQEENPYVFGPMRITPATDAAFTKSSALNVLFWIYGADEASSGKPDVVVEFAFHQRLPEGEEYFNRTAPQELNAETLPPQFDLNAGHQLPGSLVVPLASFPAGDYRLEITVTDNSAGAKLVRNVNFSVAG